MPSSKGSSLPGYQTCMCMCVCVCLDFPGGTSGKEPALLMQKWIEKNSLRSPFEIYICVCVCIYMYIYIHTHTHSHTVEKDCTYWRYLLEFKRILTSYKERRTKNIQVTIFNLVFKIRTEDKYLLLFIKNVFKVHHFSFFFNFIFKLYIIVLVLPNIKMNPPQVYMCSPS